MRPECFHLIDDTSIDTSIFKRECMNVYRQQAAELRVRDQGIDFIFDEISIITK